MTAKLHNSYLGLIDDATRRFSLITDTPRIDAEVLMQHLLQRPLAWLLANGDKPASDEHREAYRTLTDLRHSGQPIAYITGHKEFWSLDLDVTPEVLIPRPDTEVLVELALRHIDRAQANKVLDMGTGSGAIALALAKELPRAQVLGVDISDAALSVAKHNAKKSSLSNVRFICSNWFSKVEPQLFDLITANPPYIKVMDPHLEQGDLRFEPDIALIGGGDGLDDIRLIISTAPRYLKSGGYLVVEHGYDQAEAVTCLLSEAGFCDLLLAHDLNSLPRCTIGVST